MRALPKRRWITIAAACVVLLGVGGYVAYQYFLLSSSICQEVAAGVSLENLSAALSKRGVDATISGDGTHFIIEHFVSGGIGCTVEVRGGRVISASLAGPPGVPSNTSLERTPAR